MILTLMRWQQHYGFDTCLLDLTNDFRTALFFCNV
ncbi:MAG: FRG domain-containing protein [Ruminococcus bromii]|nr:FRG domain-containing protein [Ruminococcus bromii]